MLDSVEIEPCSCCADPPHSVAEAFRRGGAGLHHRLGNVPRSSGVRAGRRRMLKARLIALPDLQQVAPFLGLIRGGTQQP